MYWFTNAIIFSGNLRSANSNNQYPTFNNFTIWRWWQTKEVAQVEEMEAMVAQEVEKEVEKTSQGKGVAKQVVKNAKDLAQEK